ncbi:LamG domain-containing protein [Myxococcus xanthus]|nr:LamG domain-containing protein [Myxococcus xanthus]
MRTMSEFSSRNSKPRGGWDALRQATKVSAMLAGVLGLVGCTPEQQLQLEQDALSSSRAGLTMGGSSLLHRYSFTAGGTDSVSAAHATLEGGATTVNGEVILNGAGAYVNLPITGTLASLQDATFEAWVKWDSASGQTWARIFDFNDGVWYKSLVLTPRNGGFDSGPAVNTPRFSIFSPAISGEEQATSAIKFPMGALTHVAVTMDSVARVNRLYIDGVQVAQTTTPTALTPASLGTLANAWLGRSAYSADPFFKGSISEFRVHGAALSSNALTASYQAGPDTVMAPGTEHVVIDGRTDVAGMAADTTSVYWVEKRTDGQVMKASLSTGRAQVLASGRENPSAVTTDATFVYWVENGTTIFKMPVNGGSITSLASGLSGIGQLVTDGAELFWTQGGSILHMPVQGGTPAILYTTALAGPLAVDGHHLYWMVPGGTIVKAAKPGGPASSFWNSSNSTTGIASDGTDLFIAENLSPYDILRLPVGGSQWALAFAVRYGNITSLAVGPNRVAWFDPSLGAILAKGK